MEGQDVKDASALLKRIEELEARVALLTKAPRTGGMQAGDDAPADATTSRRGLLKLAGATAVGAAATTLLAATPAAAADGGAIDMGSDNAEEQSTFLHYDGTSAIGSNNLLTAYDYTTPGGLSGSNFPAAVAGWAANGPAGIKHGTYGYTVISNGYGAVGWGNGDTTTHGMYALSAHGYGLVANGPRAPIVLLPAGSAGSPSAGTHQLGELYVDSGGILYRCVAAGTPGTWAPLNSVVPLATPVRVVDTRDGTGDITGPLIAGTGLTSSNITGGSSGIPAEAVAVVGTLTMVASTTGGNLPGSGYLTAYPGAAAVPPTSNINADTSHAIASGLTVALGTGSNAGEVSFYASIACHALLDVAAYII